MSPALVGTNHEIMAKENRALIISLLREGVMSRNDLAKTLRLSNASVGDIVNSFLTMGLLIETGQESTESVGRGRRPVGLSINPKFGFAVGAELTEKRLRIGAVGVDGNIIEYTHFWFPERLTREMVIENLFEEIRTISSKVKGCRNGLLGIGVAIHGTVNEETGVSMTFPPCDDWIDVPLGSLLSEEFHVRSKVIARLYANTVAELRFGLGRQEPDMVYFNSGEGIGFNIGIVSKGQILRGSSGFAGQFGHISMEVDGPLCFCGSRGCLVALASPKALCEKVLYSIKFGGVNTNLVKKLEASGEISFDDIVEAAREGDKLSIGVLREAGKYLGRGMGYLLNLLDPGKIVIAGKLAAAGDLLLDVIRDTAQMYSIPQIFDANKFCLSNLGETAGVLGAATLSLDEFFEEIAAGEVASVIA